MEHPELIETAFVNYLTGLSVWSAGLLIFPGENNLDKDDARIVAYIDGEMGDEDPPNSGNRWADVIIELRTPFGQLTAKEVAANVADPLAVHKANAAALATAIESNTLPDQLTAAVDGFTCFGLAQRTPTREERPEYWSSGWKVRLFSCPSDIAP